MAVHITQPNHIFKFGTLFLIQPEGQFPGEDFRRQGQHGTQYIAAKREIIDHIRLRSENTAVAFAEGHRIGIDLSCSLPELTHHIQTALPHGVTAAGIRQIFAPIRS